MSARIRIVYPAYHSQNNISDPKELSVHHGRRALSEYEGRPQPPAPHDTHDLFHGRGMRTGLRG